MSARTEINTVIAQAALRHRALYTRRVTAASRLRHSAGASALRARSGKRVFDSLVGAMKNDAANPGMERQGRDRPNNSPESFNWRVHYLTLQAYRKHGM